MKNSRVPILDGLRVLAIGMVVLGHYYNFSKNEIIRFLAIHGYLGVQIFFIISGFVISISLENSKNYLQFFKKRYIRLAPGMFICSTLTYLFFSYIYTGEGYYNSKNIINYFLANTFIDPNFIDIFIGYTKYYYIDNAYWSLWVEVNFYFIIGFLYFLSPKKMIRNYILLCIIGVPIFLLFSSEMGHHILQNFVSPEKIKYYKFVSRSFIFFHECLWFLIGLFLYKLYTNKKEFKNLSIMIALMIVLAIWGKDIKLVFIYLSILLLFLIFIYFPEYLSFLNNKYLCKLGVASYSLYLIHYHIGVATINCIYNYFGKEILFIPLIITFLACIFSLFSYNYLETPLSKVLKKTLLSKKI
jgi:peptidoglycan/LPS O-acetylase OafA/YrhL